MTQGGKVKGGGSVLHKVIPLAKSGFSEGGRLVPFLSLIGSIIFGQQVEAVLVHAYALLLGVFGNLN